MNSRRRHSRQPLSQKIQAAPRRWKRVAFAVLARDPLRIGIIAVAGVLLSWLVLTRSLPFALAETAPEAALWLNPNQPRALLVLAGRARSQLLRVSDLQAGPAGQHSMHPQLHQTEAAGPEAADRDGHSPKERQRAALRDEIRRLASRVIAVAPLEAGAYRLLAEISDNKAETRALMQEAARRSRHESLALFWLMDDSAVRGDLKGLAEMADDLLRTRIDLIPYVMRYLGEMAATHEGRRLLAARVAKNPAWRGQFFDALPKHVRDPAAPLDLMLVLNGAGSRVSAKEGVPYLELLVRKNLVAAAYDAWLQLLPAEKLAGVGLLNNAGFADEPSGTPFDWTIRRGQNSVVEFLHLPGVSGNRSLRYSFGTGRVKFPETSQLLLLTPGRYRLEGSRQGAMAAKRGLRWEVRCLGASAPLAETDMLYGNPRDWQDFTVDIAIPDGADCRAQQLRLYHHARSPSEELIAGEIAFRGLRLMRVGPER